MIYNNDLYVIHSQSERGYWNNELGWVNSANDATKFRFGECTASNLPQSSNDDSEVMVYTYAED